MMTTKAEKQGNAMIITLPEFLEVKDGEEFFIVKKENGIIVLVPKLEDPFEYAENGKLYISNENMDHFPVAHKFD